MHTLLLAPTDTLFFRDGRPMTGALAGHAAAWPLPTVGNHALHAALWRSGFAETAHVHRPSRSGRIFSTDRKEHGERFGSLSSAGPFPVCTNGAAHTWFFPRPFDALNADTIVLRPALMAHGSVGSHSAVHGLRMPVGSTRGPSKETVPGWWSEGAWNAYLGSPQRDDLAKRPFYKSDSDFADVEHTVGIGMDSATGATRAGALYTSHYLRLREGWRLGMFAKAEDKGSSEPGSTGPGDLIKSLFGEGGEHIVIGGQQRTCTARRVYANAKRFPLPLGRSSGFETCQLEGKEVHLVKWVLLTPAVWPEIQAKAPSRESSVTVRAHPGGWLPNWIDAETKQVLLRGVSKAERNERRSHNYAGRGYRSDINGTAIHASLVAAIVPKPQVITGWSLGDERTGEQAGAKPTHLAVAAGAVYYFACASSEDARLLAEALNWHGSTAGAEIQRRRSTLLGEKGFGLGVCGTWQPLNTTT